MELVDIIVIVAILLIVGGAVAYIIKAKKSGKKCIGWPHSCSCSGKRKKGSAESGCGSCRGCHNEDTL